MKATLFALFVALLLVGCGEEVVDQHDLEDRGGIMYLNGERLPFTGYVKEDFPDGQKKEEGNYKDGKKEGIWTWWYENGQKEWERTYKDGKEDGLHISWYENGQKESEENFKDGKEDGLWTSWYENGQKEQEGNFKDDKPDGLYTSWYENGQKKEESNWRDDKLMSAEVWKPNGEKCPVTNVKDGDGVGVRYNEDGTEKARYTYKDGEVVRD